MVKNIPQMSVQCPRKLPDYLNCGRSGRAPALIRRARVRYNAAFAFDYEGPAVNFIDKLSAAWTKNNSLLCVGLDPDLARFPDAYKLKPDAILPSAKRSSMPRPTWACAFKPQIAYFAALGAERQLEQICAYLRASYPDIPLILDAKRGDIGATAHQYAREGV